MKKSLTSLILLFTISITAQDLDSFFKNSDSFFKQYVSKGRIDYKAIKKNTESLDALLTQAKAIRVTSDDSLNYQAFWINSYNLLVIKGIINHFPINSPLDVSGFFDKIKYEVGGLYTTLNNIENKLLRAKYKDARFHFVLVCGAIGCPPIINKAYKPESLNQQLTAQTKKAINTNFIKVDRKKKRVKVSQIMEWYKEDFNLNGNEIDFINSYLEQPLSQKFKLSYFEYDWRLNTKS